MCDKEETGGKKKGGLVRWLKKRFSKKRDRAGNKSKGYEELETKAKTTMPMPLKMTMSMVIVIVTMMIGDSSLD